MAKGSRSGDESGAEFLGIASEEISVAGADGGQEADEFAGETPPWATFMIEVESQEASHEPVEASLDLPDDPGLPGAELLDLNGESLDEADWGETPGGAAPLVDLTVDLEGVGIDDPVRLYLREI